MNNYEIRVVPKLDIEGNTYWTAFYPAIDGCVGGGVTPEDAIEEAQENLEIYLNYMEENDCSLPDPYEENQYSGKIALRVSKSVHKKLAQISEDEGISINSFINGAINHALGTEETNKKLEQMVSKIQENTEKNLKLQKFDLIFSQQIAQQWGNTLLEGVSINED